MSMTTQRAHSKVPSYQTGVALVLVLTIVAMMTIIATQLLFERNLHARRTSNIILSENAWSYAVGAEKLASIAIVKSLKNQDNVNLAQAWATEDVIFPIEGGSIAAKLKDMRSCFNLNGILSEKSSENNANNENQQNNDVRPIQREFNQQHNSQLAGEKIFEQFISDLRLTDVNPTTLAATLRDWIDKDIQPTGTEGREDYDYEAKNLPYKTGNTLIGSRTELLTISGYTRDVVQQILPYVCVIPQNQDLVLNVNTIAEDQPELLSSFYKNLDVNTASTILSARPVSGYDQNNFSAELPADAKLMEGARIEFSSEYFEVSIKVALGNTRVNLKSILQYKPNSDDIIVLARMGLND